MHRLVARLLLLVALVGNFAPPALALTAAPPHACCRRQAGRQCHETLASETGLVIRDAGCCNHECCRALTSAQWAHALPKLAAFFLQTVKAPPAASQPKSPATASAEFQSSRAPPTC